MSCNRPSLLRGDNGGSAGLLRCGKGTTWEGGQRMPAIAWWLGKIRKGKTFEVSLIYQGIHSKKLFVTLTYFLSFEMRHGSIF